MHVYIFIGYAHYSVVTYLAYNLIIVIIIIMIHNITEQETIVISSRCFSYTCCPADKCMEHLQHHIIETL